MENLDFDYIYNEATKIFTSIFMLIISISLVLIIAFLIYSFCRILRFMWNERKYENGKLDRVDRIESCIMFMGVNMPVRLSVDELVNLASQVDPIKIVNILKNQETSRLKKVHNVLKNEKKESSEKVKFSEVVKNFFSYLGGVITTFFIGKDEIKKILDGTIFNLKDNLESNKKIIIISILGIMFIIMIIFVSIFIIIYFKRKLGWVKNDYDFLINMIDDEIKSREKALVKNTSAEK